MQQLDWKFGPHSVRYEAPDIVLATFVGPIDLDEIKRAVDVYGEIAQKYGPYYLIADIGQSQLGAEPRRYLSENAKADWFKGSVYVGADVVQQTFGKVIALGMLFTGKSRFETTFVKDHEEARAWVAQHRQKHKKKLG
ncbi:STAS/SEC14 domain-containing protein [Corallococcus macrosporus]|uniref:STAS/SEC14 domain-containing protein n=1 Tax=Corallococcus macrosporus DSM 14697 TaxID=1189310 RepID=A0A286NW07_9BACT|nr:STAS/SEC14 domain-containing protein [Corallococcus macrosporus]ATB51352.1 hypothetical protein MYMAC_007010 [Corallococcus macrosporus DSM 14697]